MIVIVVVVMLVVIVITMLVGTIIVLVMLNPSSCKWSCRNGLNIHIFVCCSYEVLQYPLTDFLAEEDDGEDLAQKEDFRDEVDDTFETEVDASRRCKFVSNGNFEKNSR